ncbi:MAG TPA: hypothetical protein VFQ38_23120 [Longimicrobiales bacterium]|nr:hypothetical protein [Longimicrobiales bacterium]
MLLAVLAGAGCDRTSRSADQRTTHTLPLGKDTLRLGSGVAVLDVRLRQTPAGGAVEPDTVRAHPGDVVRFIAADPRGYAVAFDTAGLAPDAREFLERTGQLRGPPLVSTGATWVVSLEGAPSGTYAFHSLTADAQGLLLVQARVPARP